MSEAGDYVPAPHWQGTIDNFASARATYDDVSKSVTPSKTPSKKGGSTKSISLLDD